MQLSEKLRAYVLRQSMRLEDDEALCDLLALSDEAHVLEGLAAVNYARGREHLCRYALALVDDVQDDTSDLGYAREALLQELHRAEMSRNRAHQDAHESALAS